MSILRNEQKMKWAGIRRNWNGMSKKINEQILERGDSGCGMGRNWNK